MKYVIVILDGASGWPLTELGGQTTLAAAATPTLDMLARQGTVGLSRTVPTGTEPSSSAACMSILGYDPVADHIGRGAIEAASIGIELGEEDVALRLNLVTIEDGRMYSYACGHIPSAESREIIAELDAMLADETLRVYPGVSYRHILVIKGHPEIMQATFTPPHDIPDQTIADHLPHGPGAEILLDLMEKARRMLSRSRINQERISRGEPAATDVWPFWPGLRPAGLVSFERRHGVRAAITSAVDLLNGLAVLAGIRRLTIDGVTDGHDNDYAGQACGALDALDEYDCVIIHIESPDEAGHGGDITGKIAAIEAIDREVIARVAGHPDELRILAMPDHATPIARRSHVDEPVPFVLWGAGIDPNGASRFDEDAAVASGLLVDPGHRLIDRLLAPEPISSTEETARR